MIPDQTFHCPHCGAPGQITAGALEYSCSCRFSHIVPPYPQPYYQVPPPPYPYYQPVTPWYTLTCSSGSATSATSSEVPK